MRNFLDMYLLSRTAGWDGSAEKAAGLLNGFQSPAFPLDEITVESEVLRFNPEAAVKALQKHRKERLVSVVLRSATISHMLFLYRQNPIDLRCWTKVATEALKTPDAIAALTGHWAGLAERCNATYGVAHEDFHSEYDPQFTKAVRGSLQVKNLYWLNLFSPEATHPGVPGERRALTSGTELIVTEANWADAPLPGSWWPASDALSSDVGDQAGWIDFVEKDKAAELVEALGSELGSVLRNEPAGMAALDSYFRAHPDRQDLARALGAWIGRMIVRELGGKWIPREDWEQTRVVAGSHAWLPFLAATRFLKDPEAASLAVLYQAAERHAKAQP